VSFCPPHFPPHSLPIPLCTSLIVEQCARHILEPVDHVRTTMFAWPRVNPGNKIPVDEKMGGVASVNIRHHNFFTRLYHGSGIRLRWCFPLVFEGVHAPIWLTQGLFSLGGALSERFKGEHL